MKREGLPETTVLPLDRGVPASRAACCHIDARDELFVPFLENRGSSAKQGA
jgi:hypothetical protein